jgi:hypothetical protein
MFIALRDGQRALREAPCLTTKELWSKKMKVRVLTTNESYPEAPESTLSVYVNQTPHCGHITLLRSARFALHKPINRLLLWSKDRAPTPRSIKYVITL